MRNKLHIASAADIRPHNFVREWLLPLTFGLALLHPRLFGVCWIALTLYAVFYCLCGGYRANTDQLIAPRIWLIALGPLLGSYIISGALHGSAIGRIEALEPVMAGAIVVTWLTCIRFSFLDVLTRGAMLGSFFAITITIYDIFFLSEPRAGVADHPINFGIACGAALLVLIVRLQNQLTLTLVLGALACGVALVASGSRGPVLAFFLCLLLLIFGTRLTKPNKRSRVVLLLTALILGPLGGVMVSHRFAVDASLAENSSIAIRWELIKISFFEMFNRPWFGIGPDRAGEFFSAFTAPVNQVNHAHVTMLNLGLELGILGLLSWIWCFGLILTLLWKWKDRLNHQDWQTGVLLTAYLFICSMGQDVMSHAFTRRFYALMLIMVVVVLSTKTRAVNESS